MVFYFVCVNDHNDVSYTTPHFPINVLYYSDHVTSFRPCMGLHCVVLALFGFPKHYCLVLALFGFSKHQGLCLRWVSFETWFHIESIPPWFSIKLCFSHIGNRVARRAPIAPSLISKNIDAKPLKNYISIDCLVNNSIARHYVVN